MVEKKQESKALDAVTDKVQERELKGASLSATGAASTAPRIRVPAADMKVLTAEFGLH